MDFELEYINPLGAAICKSSPPQAIAHRITSIMPGACGAGLLKSLRTVVTTGEPADIELADLSSSSRVWLRFLIVRVEQGLAMSFSDITQNKQLATELKQRAADLQRANAVKSRFLATLSHELRNPLAPIRNGVAIIKERNPPGLGDIPAMMERQVRIASRLIDDLLDASRIDRGRLGIHRETVRLDSILDAAVETSRPNIVAKSHELHVRHAPDTVHIEADPTRLAQVISNLLNNAAKFTPANGRIVLSAPAKAGLRDDPGSGQWCWHCRRRSRRQLRDVCAARSGKSGAGDGLGLGLALARSLISLHGGEITAHSAGVGKGSELSQMIRGQPWGQALKLIALTMGQPEDHARTRAAGFDQHLTKPVDPEELASAIATMV